MNYFYSILAGIIQGLTEFLPISSSGHLVLFHEFTKFTVADEVAFDVVLHLGTMLALLIFFWKDIISLIKAFIESFYKRDSSNLNQRLSWYLLLATIPAVIAGVLFEKQIESFFRNANSVAATLIIFGVLLWLADHYSSKIKNIFQITLKDSIIIGLAQVIALVPGVSRSGITIIAGLNQKFKRADAAKFSFLLAIPVVFGAGTKKIIDFIQENQTGLTDVNILIIGFVSATVTGYFCIKYFLKFLQSHSLKIFAYYRIALGILILIIFNLL